MPFGEQRRVSLVKSVAVDRLPPWTLSALCAYIELPVIGFASGIPNPAFAIVSMITLLGQYWGAPCCSSKVSGGRKELECFVVFASDLVFIVSS